MGKEGKNFNKERVQTEKRERMEKRFGMIDTKRAFLLVTPLVGFTRSSGKTDSVIVQKNH